MPDVNSTICEILNWLSNRRYNEGCKGVVLGLSGGKDSTVVAMLAKKVWGNNVVAVLMPNGEQADIDDSIEIAEQLNLKTMTVNIGEAFAEVVNGIEFADDIKVTSKAKTNIPPRLRMTVLYAIAQTLGYQVIGTGNYSERYLGFFTKFGDGGCDFNPIYDLTCMTVVEIGKVLAKDFGLPEKYIVKAPGDGLTGKTDEDNFGFTYEELEEFFLGKITPHMQKIKAMHDASEHKRSGIPHPGE